jgi:hypothetical protein
MSLSDVRPYIRTRMNNLGYAEHTEPFDVDSIPDTLIDGSYQIEQGSISPVSHSMQALVLTVSTTIHVFNTNCINRSEGLDTAISGAQDIIKSMLKTTDRVTQDNIKDIILGTVSFDPFDAASDQIIETTIPLDFRVLIDTLN